MKFSQGFGVFVLTVGPALALGLSGCSREKTLEKAAPAPAPSAPVALAPAATAATYVGTTTCGSCHEGQATAYRGSHHEHAIELPSRTSVLAPFAGESFSFDGTKAKFFQKDGKFFIETPDEKGKPRAFEVAYTFGFLPLQQYLVDFGDGKLQAFVVAWDSRTKEQGGQKYFDLYPDEALTPTHELHWTRPSQNWNYACADCHSTNFEKGFDSEKTKFASKWAELTVGCEACHGPGSEHVRLARAGSLKKEADTGFLTHLSRNLSWERKAGTANAAPQSPGGNLNEIEACAPCHSRRSQLREGHRPSDRFLSTYLPELLSEGLYHADGQILDEVYEYASFLQSRMAQAGVRCSDCHDPHSLRPRAEGNTLCAQCHEPAVFDGKSHHHHEGSAPSCVDCHMPQATYMGVDARRDHSIRIPRPDLTIATGSPNACNKCHSERTPEWAEARLTDWVGPKRREHYGTTFAAARKGDPEAAAGLVNIARGNRWPAIVRASALLHLARYPETALSVLAEFSGDKEPLMRLGVTQGARGLAPEARLRLLVPMLEDPLLAIRIEAARDLVGVPLEALSASERRRIAKAIDEVLRRETVDSDRPDSWLRVALIELSRERIDEARKSLERALVLDPNFTPAMVNLADLARGLGDEKRANELLRRAVVLDPENAEAWHALGLSLVRQKDLKAAVPLLGKAAKLRPESARFHYVFAVATAENGNLPAAIAAIQEGLRHHPHDRQLLGSLVEYARAVGDQELASKAAISKAGLGKLAQ